jgi:hypothetical protein
MGGAKRYELVSAATAGELSEKVNEMMGEGWKEHGPPVPHSGQLVQAMVVTGKRAKRIRKTSED